MFYRKLILPIILITLLSTIPSLNQIVPISYAQSTKTELQDKLKGLNEDIENAKKEFNNLESQKKDLNEQVSSTKAQIIKIEGLINNTQNLITELATKIPITQNKIKTLEAQIYKLYKEIQYSSVTSKAEVLLTSKNFGDFMAKLYGLGAIQTEAERISVELKDALAQLEEEKKSQENLFKQQNESKYILNSKKSYLENLIITTENKQSEYDKKIKEQSDSASQVRDQISTLPSELRSYIANNSDDKNCYFYESRPLTYPDGFFIEPAKGAYTDNFSCIPRSFSWRGGGHDGIDIANAQGTPIVSTAKGIVEKLYTNYSAGLGLVIRHELPGRTIYSVYWHLMEVPNLSIGQEVEQGQIVAKMGSTGYSTGPHLHFMIVSESYQSYGPFCASNGRSRCYDPAKLIGY
jgi:murein DD-endopeptidase MepM/ murein hydrolase activator NlpD